MNCRELRGDIEDDLKRILSLIFQTKYLKTRKFVIDFPNQIFNNTWEFFRIAIPDMEDDLSPFRCSAISRPRSTEAEIIIFRRRWFDSRRAFHLFIYRRPTLYPLEIAVDFLKSL